MGYLANKGVAGQVMGLFKGKEWSTCPRREDHQGHSGEGERGGRREGAVEVKEGKEKLGERRWRGEAVRFKGMRETKRRREAASEIRREGEEDGKGR